MALDVFGTYFREYDNLADCDFFCVSSRHVSKQLLGVDVVVETIR